MLLSQLLGSHRSLRELEAPDTSSTLRLKSDSVTRIKESQEKNTSANVQKPVLPPQGMQGGGAGDQPGEGTGGSQYQITPQWHGRTKTRNNKTHRKTHGPRDAMARASRAHFGSLCGTKVRVYHQRHFTQECCWEDSTRERCVRRTKRRIQQESLHYLPCRLSVTSYLNNLGPTCSAFLSFRIIIIIINN